MNARDRERLHALLRRLHLGVTVMYAAAIAVGAWETGITRIELTLLTVLFCLSGLVLADPRRWGRLFLSGNIALFVYGLTSRLSAWGDPDMAVLLMALGAAPVLLSRLPPFGVFYHTSAAERVCAAVAVGVTPRRLKTLTSLLADRHIVVFHAADERAFIDLIKKWRPRMWIVGEGFVKEHAVFSEDPDVVEAIKRCVLILAEDRNTASAVIAAVAAGDEASAAALRRTIVQTSFDDPNAVTRLLQQRWLESNHPPGELCDQTDES